MDKARLRRFTRRWFAEWDPDPPAYGRASRLLHLAIEHRPDEAWQRILALIEDAPSDRAIEYVAAGPLEDLLRDHAAAFIDRVEAEAAGNDRFARSLGFVWGWLSIDPLLYARIRRAGPESSWPSDAELEAIQKRRREWLDR